VLVIGVVAELGSYPLGAFVTLPPFISWAMKEVGLRTWVTTPTWP